MTPLAQSVFKTLVFFDTQEIPLTLVEIKNYLIDHRAGVTLSEIEQVLVFELGDRVKFMRGVYVLAGQDELAASRLDRYLESFTRFNKVKKFLGVLRFFPYVRAMAISGSLAQLSSSANSDIDLFIVTAPRRIWITRALISLYFQIVGQRRHGQKVKNRFCLNHYIVDGHALNEDQNLYTAIEYASLIPVLGVRRMREFWRNNQWIRAFMANAEFEKGNEFFRFRFGVLQKFLEFVLDYTLGGLGNWVSGKYQKNRIRGQDFILVSDQELSFHPGSRGQQVLRNFARKTACIS